jgi:site-specific DNA recombinase
VAESVKPFRCAIYTRKSSEEGLDQSFNSLDAQREACAAYVLSQRHEGWILVPELYDDGGYSGGNMERPGLVQLLADIRAGKIDIIVVYKVDRLTRSLSDFAKMVDILDATAASFVSITQAFNTTTSMGRLTLNVLLSFAQFEREVTSERIRDKIAASKKKGIWMGGPVPLGYDVVDRKLIVNAHEAKTVRHICARYVTLRSVEALVQDLNQVKIRTKVTVLKTGRTRGGVAFARGGLRHLLANRLYLGELVHKGQSYPGEHQAILPQELWNQVRATMAKQNSRWSEGRRTASPSLLSGLLRDSKGRSFYASHAVKAGKRYRYYITHPSHIRPHGIAAIRYPAHPLEQTVIGQLAIMLSDTNVFVDRGPTLAATQLQDAIQRAEAALRSLQGSPSEQRAILTEWLDKIVLSDDHLTLTVRFTEDYYQTQTIKLAKIRVGIDVKLRLDPAGVNANVTRDEQLVTLLAEAYAAKVAVVAAPDQSLGHIAASKGIALPRFKRLLRLSYLSPKIIRDVLQGQQPKDLSFARLNALSNLPLDWATQNALLGTQ